MLMELVLPVAIVVWAVPGTTLSRVNHSVLCCPLELILIELEAKLHQIGDLEREVKYMRDKEELARRMADEQKVKVDEVRKASSDRYRFASSSSSLLPLPLARSLGSRTRWL